VTIHVMLLDSESTELREARDRPSLAQSSDDSTGCCQDGRERTRASRLPRIEGWFISTMSSDSELPAVEAGDIGRSGSFCLTFPQIIRCCMEDLHVDIDCSQEDDSLSWEMGHSEAGDHELDHIVSKMRSEENLQSQITVLEDLISDAREVNQVLKDSVEYQTFHVPDLHRDPTSDEFTGEDSDPHVSFADISRLRDRLISLLERKPVAGGRETSPIGTVITDVSIEELLEENELLRKLN
jgi:hypothetical protein